jgi:hypothetical protein
MEEKARSRRLQDSLDTLTKPRAMSPVPMSRASSVTSTITAISRTQRSSTDASERTVETNEDDIVELASPSSNTGTPVGMNNRKKRRNTRIHRMSSLTSPASCANSEDDNADDLEMCALEDDETTNIDAMDFQRSFRSEVDGKADPQSDEDS